MNEIYTDFSSIVLIVSVQLLAGFVKAVAGFGNGAISGPILAMRFDVANITASNGMLDIPLNGYYALKFRKAYSVKKYVFLALTVAVGGVLGAFMLKISPPKMLKIIIGLFVIFLGIRMIVKKKRSDDMNIWLKRLVLFVGGVAGGVFGMNVFFIPIYKKMSESYEEFKGSICFTYALDWMIRMPIYFSIGIVTLRILPIAAFSAIGLLAGLFIGNFAAKKMNQKTAEIFAVIIMILGGISVIFKTLVFG